MQNEKSEIKETLTNWARAMSAPIGFLKRAKSCQELCTQYVKCDQEWIRK